MEFVCANNILYAKIEIYIEVITLHKGYEKRFANGDIVYWCHNEGSGRYSVKFGMVDEQFSDAVIIDYLVLRERRFVNGVPIDKFESETKYRKLPKGWTYNTPLYELTYAPLTGEEIALADKWAIIIKTPSRIKELYNSGVLVKDSTIFHGKIVADITKDGFRIRKYYPMWEHHIDHVSIVPYKVYFTFKEAEQEVKENIAEFNRQLLLSDYEWSVEQIDKTLQRYKKIADVSDNKIKQYREWLLNMKNVEDIETRIFNGNVQWKYWEKKRWNYIEL